jgi:magnesium transporter
MSNQTRETDLRETVLEITQLLQRYQVLEELAHRQETPNRDLLATLQQRQNLADLGRRIGPLHPADLAFVLESLPRDERLLVWRETKPRQAAEALVELDPAVPSGAGPR